MSSLVQKIETYSKTLVVLTVLAMLLVIGLIDYLTGFEMLFSVFYLLGVGLASWYVGKGFGYLMSILSTVVWIAGDIAAGAQYSNSFIPVWNGVILIAFFCSVVLLLTKLRTFHSELETKVRQRTASLTQEMSERQRLESELLRVSEREQRRIGHDLHDGLCQHLTATALAGKVLAERLASQSLPETTDANQVVGLVENGITMARDLAHGLHPVVLEEQGLITALEQIMANLAKTTKLSCEFHCEGSIDISDEAVSSHLYRIVQEGVANAIRHGKAKSISISLSEWGGATRLAVEDDGIGLPENGPNSDGLGIRIMKHRAAMIGGSLSVEPALTGGTVVTCIVPHAASAESKRTGQL